jgi:hypothetical protein
MMQGGREENINIEIRTYEIKETIYGYKYNVI